MRSSKSGGRGDSARTTPSSVLVDAGHMDSQGLSQSGATILQFPIADKLVGQTKCNPYSATYEVDGASFQTTDFVITGFECPSYQLEVKEREYKIGLGWTQSARLDGRELVIESHEGKALRFRQIEYLAQ